MKKILLFVALIALLVSCTKESTQSIKNNGTLTPLKLSSASLAKIVTKSGSITIGGKIGIFLKDNLTSGYAGSANVEYDYSTADSKWAVLDAAKEIYLNNNDAEICAYYPYNAAITSPTDVDLTSQSFDPTLPADAGKDLSYAKKTIVNNTHASVNLTMEHAYSQLTFKLKKETSYTGTGAISAITIKNTGNILTSGKMSFIDGTYSAGIPGDVSYDPAIASMLTYDATDAATIDATTKLTHVLMVPVTTPMTTDVTLSFTIDGVTLSAPVPVASLSQLNPGTNYVVTVMIQGTKLVINSVTVTDWIVTDITDPVYPKP